MPAPIFDPEIFDAEIFLTDEDETLPSIAVFGTALGGPQIVILPEVDIY